MVALTSRVSRYGGSSPMSCAGMLILAWVCAAAIVGCQEDGTATSCEAFARSKCDRQSECNVLNAGSPEVCFERELETCEQVTCGDGLEPSPSSIERCLAQIDHQSCATVRDDGISCHAPCIVSEDPAGANDAYFGGWSPHNLDDCAPIVETNGARVDLWLYRGEGLDDSAVVWWTEGLQRYWGRFNIWLNAQSRPISVGYTALVDADVEELTRALDEAGVPLGTGTPLTPEQQQKANEVVAEVAYAPMREFIASHALPPRDGVIFMPVRHIVSPEVAEMLYGDALAGPEGFSLSPILFTRGGYGDVAEILARALRLEADFTACSFVADGVRGRAGSMPDNLAAHELAHALGLVHREREDNLMNPVVKQSCVLSLDADQLEGMVGARPLALTADTPVERFAPQGEVNDLVDLHRRLMDAAPELVDQARQAWQDRRARRAH